jgi:hypothetical protein
MLVCAGFLSPDNAVPERSAHWLHLLVYGTALGSPGTAGLT